MMAQEDGAGELPEGQQDRTELGLLLPSKPPAGPRLEEGHDRDAYFLYCRRQ